MTIPDPLTPIAITGSIVGNIATDILKHYAVHLEGSLAGKILKHTGLLPKTFNDRFGEVLNDSLRVLFDRFPEYRITGVIDFIKDSRFAEQLLSFLLDRKNIDSDIIQKVFAERISSDPYTVLILNRRGIEAQLIVQSFFVCYREMLLKQMELPQVFVLHEIFKQTEIVVEEIKASEGRLKEYVRDLFKDHFTPTQKPNANLWEGFIRICESKLDAEIKSSIGRKYIPDLYVSREIENQYDEFANKSVWERKTILERLKANVNDIEREISGTKEIVDKTQNDISEIDKDEQILVAFLSKSVSESPESLWRRLNSAIVYLSPIDEEIKTNLDSLGDELSTISLALSQQPSRISEYQNRLDEIYQDLLELAERLRKKLRKQGVVNLLDSKRKDKHNQLRELGERVKEIEKIQSLLGEVQKLLTMRHGQYAYEDMESSLILVDEILRRDRTLITSLGYVSKTLSMIRRHFQNCFLVIDRAGSGKTNLLCHLAKRYSKSQAVIFISGRILLDDEFGLESYIVKSVSSPDVGLDFNTLDSIDDFLRDCGKEGVDKKLLVFIDGINENSNAALFKRTIQRILATSQTKNILFCVSCRDIFWDYFRDEFWDEYVYELAKGKLYNFTEREFNVALNRYLSYYRIECQLRGEALEKCHQPLLLRFFCEAYGDPSAEITPRGEFTEIRLKKLFDDYWLRKIANTKNFLGYRTSRDVEVFLHGVSDYMWKNHTRNIPLKDLKQITSLSDLDSDKSVYIRLLDEDIIIEEGSSPKLEPWVTFVYDEFMEYSMAKGILNSLSENAPYGEIEKLIETLVENYPKFKSIEGVLGYLCIMLVTEKRKPIWGVLMDYGNPWTLVVAKAINQLSEDEITEVEFSTLQTLSKLDDDIKTEVLKCAEKIHEISSFDFTIIWSSLFQSPITRLRTSDHLIRSINSGKESALGIFFDALKDSSDELRAFSVYSLARIRKIELPVIANLVSDESEFVRQAVAFTLQLFPDGQTYLLGLLNDQDSDVRMRACLSLSKSYDVEVGFKLLEVFLYDSSDAVQDSAKASIQRISRNLTKSEQVILFSELIRVEEILESEFQDEKMNSPFETDLYAIQDEGIENSADVFYLSHPIDDFWEDEEGPFELTDYIEEDYEEEYYVVDDDTNYYIQDDNNDYGDDVEDEDFDDDTVE